MFNASKLPKHYWAEVVSTVTLSFNYAPTLSRHNHSPYALWMKLAPRIEKLQVFGCQAFVMTPKEHQEWKLCPSTAEGILLRYENSTYWILQLLDRKVVISKHIRFNESIFPELKKQDGDICFINVTWNEIEGQAVVDEAPPVKEIASLPPTSIQTKLPVWIKVIGPQHPTLVCSDIDQQKILIYSRQAGALLMAADETPRTFKAAISCKAKEVWMTAISKELLSMQQLKVWVVVDLDLSYKLVGTTWVFKTKNNHINEINEHKAHRCTQGFIQAAGVDFERTYSPTGRLNSLRTLIAFVDCNNLLFHQINVKSAFLNTPLSKTVYLSLPQGHKQDKGKFCLCLNKAIYWLKQEPLAWYERLKSWLLHVGFEAFILDPCIFHQKGEHPLWLYAHMDNIAIFRKEVEGYETQIFANFEIKDFGVANLILGVEISQEAGYITLDQQHYTESPLELYGMAESRQFLLLWFQIATLSRLPWRKCLNSTL
ncbi:hypothetical protein O181_026395 [Austropuccinia psidii MF-1]|uniref:Reverse transcriptase Ty1/copia-type domain-containing protein n=1 Tax=Austropuccinia psidii MF-1 TaxID=1389203 RepID=A0A9Q3CPB0_9BASI|nr:hypothetical protein [Austropuccinia psidii MF-1]